MVKSTSKVADDVEPLSAWLEFFDLPLAPLVLTKANPCSGIGVDRFILSCPIHVGEYIKLAETLRREFPVKKLPDKHGRIRGLRTNVKLHAFPAPTTHVVKPLPTAPQIGARPLKLELQIYSGINGHFFGLQGNGMFTPYQWDVTTEILREHFPQPSSVNVSRVEVRWDLPLGLHDFVVIPLGLKSRFTPQDGGFYFGARASDISFAVYEKNAQLGILNSPLTRIEARVRPHAPLGDLVEAFGSPFDRIGLYVTGGHPCQPYLVESWRAADTRARTRFLAKIEPCRLQVDPVLVQTALQTFAAKAAQLFYP